MESRHLRRTSIHAVVRVWTSSLAEALKHHGVGVVAALISALR